MSKRLITSLLLLFFMSILLVCGAVAGDIPAKVPQTGQTASSPLSPAPEGSDGAFQEGAAWPVPRFTVGSGTESGAVTDNLTGLMWSQNANLITSKTWPNAITEITKLNNGAGLAGYKDWRLPNLKELMSIANYSEANGASWLNGQGFSNVQSGAYWTSSTLASNSSQKWGVQIQTFTPAGYAANSYYGVWPVRGGQYTLGAPKDVAVAAGNQQASITWTPVYGATSYNVYWSNSSGSGTNGTKITGASSPYILTGLTNGTTYHFVITAVNGNGESVASSQASGMPSLKTIFLTAAAYNGNLGGFNGANAKCAADANKPAGSTSSWKAFLKGNNATKAGVPYGNTDGNLIATATSGNLTCDSNFNCTELLTPISSTFGTVWTGMIQYTSDTDNACRGWTSSDFEAYGHIGNASTTSLNYANLGGVRCGHAMKLYCVEQ